MDLIWISPHYNTQIIIIIFSYLNEYSWLNFNLSSTDSICDMITKPQIFVLRFVTKWQWKSVEGKHYNLYTFRTNNFDFFVGSLDLKVITVCE